VAGAGNRRGQIQARVRQNKNRDSDGLELFG